MNSVCVRGTYLLTRECLPHMTSSLNSHVLTVAPAPIPDSSWLGQFVCYGTTKIAMAVLCSAWSAEFPGVRFNTIWPEGTVATYAVSNSAGLNLDHAVTVASMADPAYRIVTAWNHTQFYTDAGAIGCMKVAGCPAIYKVNKDAPIAPDFMVEPEGVRSGQHIGYTPLPATATSLAGVVLVIVGRSDKTAAMAAAAKAQGAQVHVCDMTADPTEIERALAMVPHIDALYIPLGPEVSAKLRTSGTLDVGVDDWMRMSNPLCKAFYFFAQKAMPKLLKSKQPRLVVEAPPPICNPEAFTSGAPFAILCYMRAMHLIGIAEEFKGKLQANAIWPPPGSDVSVETALRALACTDTTVSGAFFAEDVAANTWPPNLPYPKEYSTGIHFFDFTSLWRADVGMEL